jgi:hypothetical protein
MPVNERESILISTKKILGLAPEFKAFDFDVMTHINSALATLTQLGVGPVQGFAIEDETAEWGDLLGHDPNLNSAKSYVFAKTKLLFDPPPTSFAIASFEKQIQEMEVRLQIYADPIRLPVVVDTEI